MSRARRAGCALLSLLALIAAGWLVQLRPLETFVTTTENVPDWLFWPCLAGIQIALGAAIIVALLPPPVSRR